MIKYVFISISMKFLSTTLALLVIVSPLFGKKSDKLEVERVASIQISAGSLNYPEKRNLIDATERVFDKAGFEMEDENGFLDPSSRREIKQYFVHREYSAESMRVELRLKNTGLDVNFDSDTTFPHASMVALMDELEKRVQSRLPSARIRTRVAKAWDESPVALADEEPELVQPSSNWVSDTPKAAPAQSAAVKKPEPVAQPVVAGDLDNIDLDALERQMAELTGGAEPAKPAPSKAEPSSNMSDKISEFRERRNAANEQQTSDTLPEADFSMPEIDNEVIQDDISETPATVQPAESSGSSSKLNDLDWGF